MKQAKELKEILEEQVKKIVKKGDITPSELDNVYKVVDIVKDLATIEAMEGGEQGSSERSSYRGASYMPMGGSWDSYRGGSYDGRGGSYRGSYDGSYRGGSYDGMSGDGRRGRDDDSDGRYSEEGSYRRGRDARGRYTSRDYSGHGDKESMIEDLRMMMDEASSEKERMAIMQCIEKLEK